METIKNFAICVLMGMAVHVAAAQEAGRRPMAEGEFVRQLEISAAQEGLDVVVSWRLEGDSGLVGFDVYRHPAKMREAERINAEFLYDTLEYGGTYEYRDSPPSVAVTYIYQIEMVFADGSRARSEPVPLTFQPPGQPAPRTAKLPRYRTAPPPVSADLLAQAAITADEIRLAALQRSTHTGGRVKITVKDPGLYRLDAATLAAKFGATTNEVQDWIGQNFLRLSSQGEKCSWIPETHNEGLYFYNPGYEDMYTLHNVFWLERESPGLVLPPVQGDPPAAAFAPMSVNQTDHFEQQLLQQFIALHAELDDYWFWFKMQAATAPAPSNLLFQATRIDTNASDARFDIHLQGASNSGVSNEHHVVVAINGTEIGHAIWEQDVPHLAHFPVPVSVLSNGNNTLSLRAILDAGVPYGTVLLDHFSLTYRMHAQATNDYLQVPPAETTNQHVSGFTTNGIRVAEILDSRQIREVENIRIDPEDGGLSSVSFTAATNGNLGHVAFTPAGALTNMAVESVPPSALRATTNRVDYLLITHPILETETRRLADFRAGTLSNLQARTVLIDDVYDEFSNGLKTPEAIRRFLAYAAQHWATRPPYVLLAGSSSLDYVNSLNYNGSLVPMVLADTPYGLYSADNLLADIEGGDGVPDYAIGRIPAVNSAQMSNVVEKIIQHENGALRPATNRAFVMADNPDEAGDFHATGDQIAALIPSDYEVGKSYLVTNTLATNYYPATLVRRDISNAFHAGTSLMFYFGHGGWDRLAGEGVFRNGDIPSLTNAPVFPLALLGTCWAARHEWAGSAGASYYFGKMLMQGTGNGSLATWGPSCEAYNTGHESLARRFLEVHAEDPALRVGDACRLAVQRAAPEVDLFHIETMTLLGDPLATIW